MAEWTPEAKARYHDEMQRLRSGSEARPSPSGSLDLILRDTRQQAIDALREVVRDEGSQWGWATIELAKELLVKLGEKP